MDGLAFTTLDSVRRQLTLNSTQVLDDLLLTQTIYEASAYFHSWTKWRTFVPFFDTREFDPPAIRAGGELEVDEDLLEVTAAVNGDGASIAPGSVRLRPLNTSPKSRVCLLPSAGSWYADWENVIAVTGFWGYHDGAPWQPTGDSVQNDPLTNSGTTLTVTDADGLNPYGLVRFEVMQYLRIEDEIVQVTAIETSSNTLTVRRGANGTTPVQHVKNTVVKGFWPMQDVEMAVSRLTVWLYKTKPEVSGQAQFADTTIVLSQAPKEVQLAAARYRKLGGVRKV